MNLGRLLVGIVWGRQLRLLNKVVVQSTGFAAF
jgi:hypothetical protein